MTKKYKKWRKQKEIQLKIVEINPDPIAVEEVVELPPPPPPPPRTFWDWLFRRPYTSASPVIPAALSAPIRSADEPAVEPSAA